MAIPEDTQDEVQEQSLEDIVSAAFDSVEAGEDVPRAEALEFDEQPTQEAQPADAKPDDAGEPSAQPDADPDPAPEPQDVAPSSWKREVADKWKDLPPEIKSEINRRETEYHKGIEPYKQYANIGRQMEQAIGPYAQNLQNSGVHPTQAIHHLLGIEDKLRNGDPTTKAQTLIKVAQDYGIDIGQLAQTPPADPRLYQMEQQLQHERMQRQQYEQTITERDNAAVMSEIDQFASDPKNTHYNAVRNDMAALLQSGMASNLQEAYDRAVWARPDLRQSLIEQERTKAAQEAAQAARQKRAQSAASGVKGSAPTRSTGNPGSDLHSIVAAAMAGDI